MRALEHEMGVLVRRIRRMIAERARMVHPDLSPVAYSMLMALNDSGPRRASDLVELFSIDKGAVSRQVQALLELGLIERSPDPEDRRAAILAITDEGLASAGRRSPPRGGARSVARLEEWSDEDLRRLRPGARALQRRPGVMPGAAPVGDATTRHALAGPMGNNGAVSDLIDTTEMYLRTIYELVEEGIVPLRARIAERLHQSGPTVSQTVARMERDGLLTVEGDRHLQLTEEGNSLAMRVMRKHRLAERLLTDVIGLDWELVHEEACRWEHVMSETVERRLLELLDHPTESPYGNPIPGLAELGEAELRRGVPRRRRGAQRRRRPRVAPGARAPDQRGDAEGRDPDGRAASRRRACRAP